MSPRILLLVVGVVGVIGFVWWSRQPTLPPEKAVAARIQDGLAAAERRDVGAVMDLISDRFESKRFDRQQLRSILFLRMQQGAWSKVLVVSQEVTAESDTRVEASLDAVLARGGNVETIEDVVPDAAGAWHFDMTWELEDGDWRIVSADYDRLRLRDLMP
jgi:hypothetical protein